MAHSDGQAGVSSQGGQFDFPQTGAGAVGTATIGTNQQPVGPRVGGLAHGVPPAAQGGHRKRGGVVVGAH